MQPRFRGGLIDDVCSHPPITSMVGCWARVASGGCRRDADERYELAPMQLIEWHTTPMSRDRTAEYRIHEGQAIFGKVWRARLAAWPRK